MEIATESEMSFPFVREAAGIAYRLVRKAEEGDAMPGPTNDEPATLGPIMPVLPNMDFDPLSEVCTPMRCIVHGGS